MWRTPPPVHDVDPGMLDQDAARRPPGGRTQTPQPDLDGGTQPPGTIGAPDFRGMASHDARRIGRASDLHVWVVTRSTEQALWDRVVAQDPAPGVALKPGDAVTITVGARPAVVVPDVRGGEEAEMLAVLRDAGLRPERRVARRSASVPEGCILRTRPRAGTTVPLGTKVSYVVATPPPLHGKQARRHGKRVRVRRLPEGAFLSSPFDD